TVNFVLDEPNQCGTETHSFFRQVDWDEPSDFGQLIRQLRLGRPEGALWAKAGAVRNKTLGFGHTLNRYSNQDLPDYHPAAGGAGFMLGPVRGEFFASDVFGARIFAGLAGLELGKLASNDPKWQDRF